MKPIRSRKLLKQQPHFFALTDYEASDDLTKEENLAQLNDIKFRYLSELANLLSLKNGEFDVQLSSEQQRITLEFELDIPDIFKWTRSNDCSCIILSERPNRLCDPNYYEA